MISFEYLPLTISAMLFPIPLGLMVLGLKGKVAPRPVYIAFFIWVILVGVSYQFTPYHPPSCCPVLR